MNLKSVTIQILRKRVLPTVAKECFFGDIHFGFLLHRVFELSSHDNLSPWYWQLYKCFH